MEVYNPFGIYVDETNSVLYVTNANGNTAAEWPFNSSTGTFLVGNTNVTAGSNLTMLNYSLDITFDSYGNMFVVDCRNHRIQMHYSLNRNEVITIIGNGKGTDSTHLNCPSGIAFDSNFNLYVVDLNNHRL
ncbi:unnamed protein product [Didymodactylos carnosus]|uniref:Uncharacterized protein n=1 Tax=Didymodactylos carnosus TaxID=1234261 RepID=A0A815E2D0_9BILA|nr:unnamed protein product [Didymodactylos carnosus]CAF4125649.1 unnamed protein product [Didymodactylos carnosus]